MIRRTLAGFLLVLLLVPASPAVRAIDPPTEADRAAIRAVIESQIAAFRRDDGEAAFYFAAPGIRRLFGTPEHFMAMVRTGYGAVYRPQAYRFGALAIIEGQVVQKVHVVGPDGGPLTAFYTMEKQPDGAWRIAGCSLGAPEEQAT